MSVKPNLSKLEPAMKLKISVNHNSMPINRKRPFVTLNMKLKRVARYAITIKFRIWIVA